VIERELKIKNRLGLHARPAAMFVNEASRYKSRIIVVKEGLEVNGKSVMGLLLLAAESGSSLKVRAEGVDEQQALSALEALFDRQFDEKDER
jgi:phosphocarrier protein